MVNLKSRIEDLQKATGSLAVKELCEKAQTKLSEINEMRISREANAELENDLIENLVKDLKIENDSETKKFVVREERLYGIHNLGVKRAISKIKESDINSHPALSYAIAHFEKLSRSPEYLIAENFYARLNAFNWHPVVKESLTDIKENAVKFKEDIIIHKAIYEIKNSRSSYILSGIRESLDDYILNRSKSSKAKLVEKLAKFTFDPLVRNLANAIRESNDNSLNIKTTNAGTEVERIYSPVIINENSEIFAVGTDIYEKEGNNLKKLSNDEISKLDPEFTKTVGFLANPSVKVSEGLITVYARNKKIEVTNEAIAVNGKTVTREDFAKIYMNAGVFRREELNTMSAITSIAENFNNVVEIEFAKRFRTPLVGNRRIDVIKLAENIFVTKEDPQMGTLDFFTNLNATQTRSIVLEFMNYDIYESFGSMIAKDDAKLRAIEESKKTYIQTISQLEEKLKELQTIDDSYVLESDEFKGIVKVLEDEISNLKEDYATFVAQSHEITEVPGKEENTVVTNEEEESTDAFTADMRVHCKMRDCDGTVTGVNDTTGKITILCDDGETSECDPSDLEIIAADVTGIEESEVEIKVDGKKIEIESDEEESDEEESDEEESDEEESDEEESDEKEGKAKDSDEEDDDKLETSESETSETETSESEECGKCGMTECECPMVTTESDTVNKIAESTNDAVNAVAQKLAAMNNANKTVTEDHTETEDPKETDNTADFTPEDRVETADGRYGSVTGVDDPTGDITVLLDDGETITAKPEELIIVDEKGVDESVNEGTGAKDLMKLYGKYGFSIDYNIDGLYQVIQSDAIGANVTLMVKPKDEAEEDMTLVLVIDDDDQLRHLQTLQNEVSLLRGERNITKFLKQGGIDRIKKESNPRKLDKLLTKSGFIQESVNEGIEAGDEVELSDGSRGQVTGADDATGDIIVLCDDGSTKTVAAEEAKLVNDKSNQVEEKEDVEGQQTDGNSVEIKE